jgi:hypothetical protein
VGYLGRQTDECSSRNDQRILGTKGHAYLDFANPVIKGENPFRFEGDCPSPVIRQHAQLTGSQKASHILARWQEMWPLFVKVLPNDYRRMVEAISAAEGAGLLGEEAIMAAFESNRRELTKVPAH